jgi:hypothetical protein
MRLRVSTTLILWPILLILVIAACGKEKKPRYTAVPITGYPYPFGVRVRNLLGKEAGREDSIGCPRYVTYRLRDPAASSRWAEYSFVTITADSAGTLQRFAATRSFDEAKHADTALLDMLGEIERRYGAATDSVVSEKTVYSRGWEDASGNGVELTRSAQGIVVVESISGRLKEDCPDAFRPELEAH